MFAGKVGGGAKYFFFGAEIPTKLRSHVFSLVQALVLDSVGHVCWSLSVSAPFRCFRFMCHSIRMSAIGGVEFGGGGG